MNNSIRTYLPQGVMPIYGEARAMNLPVTLPGLIAYAQGTILGFVAGTGTAVNDVQTVTAGGTPTGGTFILVTPLGITVAIAYNASAATVQAALVTLFGAGNVVVTGSAGGPYTVTFQGACAGVLLPVMTAINSLTGGSSPAATIAHTTPGKPAGGTYEQYASGNSDGSQNPTCVLQYPCATDQFGRITFGNTQGTEDFQNFEYSAPAWFGGEFACSDLPNLDSNAVTKLGKIILGDSTALTSPNTVLRIT